MKVFSVSVSASLSSRKFLLSLYTFTCTKSSMSNKGEEILWIKP